MSQHDWPDPSPDSPGEKRWKELTRSEMLDRAKDLLSRYEQTVMVGPVSDAYRMALGFSIEKWIRDYEEIKSEPVKYLKITVSEE